MARVIIRDGYILVADAYEVKDHLKRFGYRYYPEERAWVKPVSESPQFLSEGRRELQKLQSLGVDARALGEFLKRLEMQIEEGIKNVPVPEGLSYRRFQLEFIQHALKVKACILADEMGLGKTVQAIGLLNAGNPDGLLNAGNPDRVLIFCPAFLRLNWEKELKRWLAYEIPVYVIKGAKQVGLVLEERGIFVVSYDLASKLPDAEYDILILDEAHAVKNPAAARTYHALKVKAKKMLFLTGTPVMNKPTEVATILARIEHPEFFRSKIAYEENVGRFYWRFAYRYCHVVDNGWGKEIRGVKDPEGLRAHLAKYVIRRTKKEVLQELPAKQRSVIMLDAEGVRELLQREKELLLKLRKEREKEKSVRGGKEEEKLLFEGKTLEESIKALETHIKNKKDDRGSLFLLKHLIELKKIKPAVSLIEDILEGQERLVVFTWHKDAAGFLAKEIEPMAKVMVITSDTPMEKRHSYVQEFQSEDESPMVLISTIKAGGVGLTLTRAKSVLFVGMSYVPADLLQAEDRVHRIGQSEPVNIYYLVYEGSVDEDVFKIVEGKQAMINSLFESSEDFSYELLGLK